VPHKSLSFGEFEVGSKVYHPQTKRQGTIMTVGPADYISVQFDDGELLRTTKFYFRPVSNFDAAPVPVPPPRKNSPRAWEDWYKRNADLKFSSFKEV
jgi:hypothetical protein